MTERVGLWTRALPQFKDPYIFATLIIEISSCLAGGQVR